MYLLDTNIVIHCLKGHETVTKNLRIHLNDQIYISIYNRCNPNGALLWCL